MQTNDLGRESYCGSSKLLRQIGRDSPMTRIMRFGVVFTNVRNLPTSNTVSSDQHGRPVVLKLQRCVL